MKTFFNLLQSGFIEILKNLRGTKRLANSRSLLAYTSYGNTKQLRLIARLVEAHPQINFENSHSKFRHFLQVARLFLMHPVKNSLIKVRFQPGQDFEIKTNDFGFTNKLLLVNNAQKDRIQKVDYFSEDLPNRILSSQAKIIQPTEDTQKIFISDVDDTILVSKATSFISLAFKTLFLAPDKRKSFPEAAKVYQRLRHGKSGSENNLFFYVSSSTWDIYPLLREFLKLNRFPEGVLLLQNVKQENKKKSKQSHSHKLERIQEIIEMYPEYKIELIGDAGQADPIIYLEIANRYPKMVDKILIRNRWWDPNFSDQEAYLAKAEKIGVEMHFFSSLEEIYEEF
ncbi:MAG: App1 family protein [Bdellovibrionota bacterium]|nr:App1 family protein [Bdellovibrionota bacterium]